MAHYILSTLQEDFPEIAVIHVGIKDNNVLKLGEEIIGVGLSISKSLESPIGKINNINKENRLMMMMILIL